MKVFENKDINEEIATSTELDNDEVLNDICDTLTVTKTATPEDDACTTKIVDVELKVEFAEKLGLVTITDNVSSVFVDSIIEGSATGDPVSNGSIRIEKNSLKVIWEDLNVTGAMTATLRFKVLVKDEAIDNENAYVNNNIHVNADRGRNCTFPLLKGEFYIPPCPESPTVTSLVKDNDKNEYGCDEIVTSTLTITIDKADTNIVITDDIANELVGNPTNFTVSPGNASTDIVYDGDKIIWTVNQEYASYTQFTLSYQFNSSEIVSPGYVSNSVTIYGDNFTQTFPRDNAEFPFDDDYVVDCPEENGECCCQACQPITVRSCETFIDETINVESIRCTGKLVNVTVNLQNICPGRTLNVGVLLVENVTVSGETTQESRGFIVKQVTNTSTTACTDIPVSGFCFPFADDTRCDAGDRTFIAKVFATYIGGNVPDCDCDAQTQEP